jgi:hypothetical protein
VSCRTCLRCFKSWQQADLAWDEVLEVQEAKREERGGFGERLWLEGLAYCRLAALCEARRDSRGSQ